MTLLTFLTTLTRGRLSPSKTFYCQNCALVNNIGKEKKNLKNMLNILYAQHHRENRFMQYIMSSTDYYGPEQPVASLCWLRSHSQFEY